MRQPEKDRIRQSFERAAATYDSATEVQRRLCHRLLSGLSGRNPAPRILDAGCGTGFAHTLLAPRFPDSAYLGLDLSAAMLAHLPPTVDRLLGDMENLALPDASIDLYWSSLAAQWCELGKVLREARRVLAPQGELALATLGPRTFHELRFAFSGVDRHQHTLSFRNADEVRAEARACGWTDLSIERVDEIAYYPDFRSLLKAVKASGANQLGDGRRTSLLSRAAFAQAEAAAETLRTPLGLPLTYDAILLHAQS